MVNKVNTRRKRINRQGGEATFCPCYLSSLSFNHSSFHVSLSIPLSLSLSLSHSSRFTLRENRFATGPDSRSRRMCTEKNPTTKRYLIAACIKPVTLAEISTVRITKTFRPA